MTLDEAFQEIGVAPGGSQDEIRRAYLRLVKVRKPESDPEGFRRLREAYELLQHRPELSPEIRLPPRPAAVERPASPEVDLEESSEVEPEDDPADLIDDAAETVLLILRLQAQGHTDEADRVQERFHNALRSSGQELSLLDDRTAALWQIAQELPRLSADFPEPTRAAISAAVIAGAPEMVIPHLLDIVAEDGDAGWRMAAELKDLPGLGSLYHDVVLESLEKRQPRRRPAAQSPWRPSTVGGALIVIWFLALASGALNRPVPQEPLMRYPSPLPSVPARHSATPPLAPSAGEALSAACLPGVSTPAGRAEFCQAARNAIGHLRQSRCGEALAAREQLAEGLKRMHGSAFEQPADDLLAAIRAEYATVCQDDAF